MIGARRPMSPVNPDRWRAISPYLDEALDLAGDARAAWLVSLSARDAALAADLRSLLDEHDAAHEAGFLEDRIRGVPHPAPAQSLAGQTVGSYRLLSLIGQGGMGSVWLAERCDGRFEGRAAVKLLNIALMGRAVEGRFRREGTILARVTHPHIAHLIDAGVTATGQPYLVLELVEGQHIDRYCAEQSLGVEARLRLFLDVLGAVAHAHANLIVPRDIKPPIVLVSAAGQV
jgi:eukaryotic-like serine/threonine-protein kinase